MAAVVSTGEPRRRFFTPLGTEVDERHHALSPPANQSRPMTAAAARIRLDKSSVERVDKRKPSAWQLEAWRFFDVIGELHFSFELLGSIISRVRLFAAVIVDPDRPPIPVYEFLEQLDSQSGQEAEATRRTLELADKLVRDLLAEAEAGAGGLLRDLGINFGVAGECYLVRHDGQWIVASSDELVASGQSASGGGKKYKLSRDRQSKSSDVELDENAFVARLWRRHPRRGNEPDSSMLGVLDSCSTLVLLEQAVRVQTRSRLNAGLVVIPEGIVPIGAGPEDTVESVIVEAATRSAEDEGAAVTVTPLVFTGPPELAKEVRRIELGRTVDEVTLGLLDRTLERVLTGIDIPRDVVKGLAGLRYSNAIVVDDNLYRAHVEPLAMLISDVLTSVYLKPSISAVEGARRETAHMSGPDGTASRLSGRLKLAGQPSGNGNGAEPALEPGAPLPTGASPVLPVGVGSDILDRIVLWFDPSAIVIRSDKSQAANEGYDRHLLSGESWRSSRGFNEGDAPGPEEIRNRLAVERAPITPDIGSVLVEALDPDFFESQRATGQAEAGVPGELSQLLAPGGAPAGEEATALAQAQSGGELAPGGNLPPQPDRQPTARQGLPSEGAPA